MSESILKILLSELKNVRIVCKLCGTITEIPIAMLDRRHPNANQKNDAVCVGCGENIRRGRPALTAIGTGAPNEDPFDLLAEAWEQLGKMQDKFDIQFVVKAPDAP